MPQLLVNVSALNRIIVEVDLGAGNLTRSNSPCVALELILSSLNDGGAYHSGVRGTVSETNFPKEVDFLAAFQAYLDFWGHTYCVHRASGHTDTRVANCAGNRRTFDAGGLLAYTAIEHLLISVVANGQTGNQ